MFSFATLRIEPNVSEEAQSVLPDQSQTGRTALGQPDHRTRRQRVRVAVFQQCNWNVYLYERQRFDND